ncbi:hypothetical protein [Bradyrhizobium sp. McL0616]
MATKSQQSMLLIDNSIIRLTSKLQVEKGRAISRYWGTRSTLLAINAVCW